MDDSYVQQDDAGTFRVGRADVPLDSVIAAFQQGHSAETIRDQYPSLTLAEVYGAIAFYLGRREEVDAYLRRQDEVWESSRTRAERQPSEVVRRLRAIKRDLMAGKK